MHELDSRAHSMPDIPAQKCFVILLQVISLPHGWLSDEASLYWTTKLFLSRKV